MADELGRGKRPKMPSFIAEPVILGVVGDSSVIDIAATRTDFRDTIEAPNLKVLTNHELRAWSSSTGKGWYWQPFDRSVSPATWRDAQVEAMAAGIAVDAQGARLHNDHLGIHELHYFERHGSVVFSNWLPLLVDLSQAEIPDPHAWASMLLLGFATPARSQFAEIHSLGPFSSLTIGRGSVRIEHSDPTQAGDSKANEEVVDAIRAALPGSSIPNVVYPLSGGWDSRLLLGAAQKVASGIETWTTTATSNWSADPTDSRLAQTVASYLGTRHREVDVPLRRQLKAIDNNLNRNHCSTWFHPWLEPFGERLRRRRLPVVDGLGAVWIKGFLQNPADDPKGDQQVVRYALWERLGGRTKSREDIWSQRARTLFEEVGFQDWDEVVRPFCELHSWQSLSILTTRTANAISLAPLRLFGPEADIYFPLITGRTLRTALSPDIYARRGEQFAFDLIALTDPKLASIPSTNDRSIKTERKKVPPRFHARTLNGLTKKISSCEPAIELLSPKLAKTLIDRDSHTLGDLMSDTATFRGVMGAYTFAAWLEENPQIERSILD